MTAACRIGMRFFGTSLFAGDCPRSILAHGVLAEPVLEVFPDVVEDVLDLA